MIVIGSSLPPCYQQRGLRFYHVARERLWFTMSHGVTSVLPRHSRVTVGQATSFANDVAGAVGIEPTQAVLETAVLPLYDTPKVPLGRETTNSK